MTGDAQPIRVLTDAGLARFRRYLGELRAGSSATPPRDLLTEREFSEEADFEGEVAPRRFKNRLEAARYLDEALETAGAVTVDESPGLWGWLSLFFFDQVCPPDRHGVRSPGPDYRHVLEPGFFYGHRNLLAGSLAVYRLHRDESVVRLLLCTKPSIENGFHHDLASRQSLIANRSILEATHRLYLSRRGRGPKRGCLRGRDDPGSLRRFIDVVQQLDVNYDLHSMTADAILDLLPEEFDRWKTLRMRHRGRKARG